MDIKNFKEKLLKLEEEAKPIREREHKRRMTITIIDNNNFEKWKILNKEQRQYGDGYMPVRKEHKLLCPNCSKELLGRVVATNPSCVWGMDIKHTLLSCNCGYEYAK